MVDVERDGLRFGIQLDVEKFRGVHGVRDERLQVAAVRDHVDALAAELVRDVADAEAAHADAGADRIDARVVGLHGDLRAGSRSTRDADDLDHAVMDLGDFAFEEAADEIVGRTGEDEARAGSFHVDLHEQGADAVARGELFAGDAVASGDDALRLLDVDDDARGVGVMHRAGHDLADLVLELVMDEVLFRLAEQLPRPGFQFAGAEIDFHVQIGCGMGAFLVCGKDCLFQCLDHLLFADAAFLLDVFEHCE